MSDKEKMMKLFQAALNDTGDNHGPLARAFPTAIKDQAEMPSAAAVQSSTQSVGALVSEAAAEVTAPGGLSDLVQPLEQAGLCETVSAELGVLLDEQQKRKVSRRRQEVLMTCVVIFGLTGGSFAWFVHSPQRVLAAKLAIKEIRSAGDIGAIVTTYKKSLAKIATRSTDINTATESMGFISDQTGMKDVDLDAEMKEMMGGEGKTAGERNRMLKKNFGDLEKTGGKLTSPPAASSATKPGEIPPTPAKLPSATASTRP